tara:strand:+ start:1443 stop:1838 length:396 start_codon:yes stop_codon:yes gene_type:complete
MEYTDDKIKSIITQYKKKRERENKMYHEELKHDENWRKKNNDKSKDYYKINKEAVRKKYLSDNEYIKIRNLYRYYLRCNRVQDFKDKYPEKYMYLENRGYIPIHQNTDTLPENPPGIKDFFDVIDEHTETA